MGQVSHIQLQNSFMFGNCVTNKPGQRGDISVTLLDYTLKGLHYNRENLIQYSWTAMFGPTRCLSLLWLKIKKGAEEKNFKLFPKQKQRHDLPRFSYILFSFGQSTSGKTPSNQRRLRREVETIRYPKTMTFDKEM